MPVDGDPLAAADRDGFSITYDDLVECVETNDKQRFAFDVTGELIRANQGHSVEVDLQLEEREPPETLYHGTVEAVPAADLERGAGPGQAAPRPFVEGRGNGTQGRGKEEASRSSSKIDAGKMHCDGHKFLLSVNGVWLNGFVVGSEILGKIMILLSLRYCTKRDWMSDGETQRTVGVLRPEKKSVFVTVFDQGRGRIQAKALIEQS